MILNIFILNTIGVVLRKENPRPALSFHLMQTDSVSTCFTPDLTNVALACFRPNVQHSRVQLYYSILPGIAIIHG